MTSEIYSEQRIDLSFVIVEVTVRSRWSRIRGRFLERGLYLSSGLLQRHPPTNGLSLPRRVVFSVDHSGQG